MTRSALRAAMEEVLRPLGMSVTHYSCLELLAQRPGLSNSELARGAFVTRQTMNVLLQALERDGYVTRPAEAPPNSMIALTNSAAEPAVLVGTVPVGFRGELPDGTVINPPLGRLIGEVTYSTPRRYRFDGRG
ncbi:MarR family winged helix-turn-helix transcriptional regulator [Nocardia sp. CA-084685]|uniref:MarR family winged helix-turn-helix transcriptional regulator n=1 Tax=Nocardia sp. CA-084685 TaxID=3239970 RepID=UPI003D953201